MEPRSEPVHGHRTLLFLLLAGWSLLFLAIAAFTAAQELARARTAFFLQATYVREKFERVFQDSQIILRGFAAHVRTDPYATPDETRVYTHTLLERYEDTYLEIVDHVRDTDLTAYIADRRRQVDPRFDVRTFGYRGDRRWRAVRGKSDYYPIAFIDPLPTATRDVLGLDISSVDFLEQAFRKAAQTMGEVATAPFTLAEGPRAYGLITAVGALDTAARRAPSLAHPWAPAYVELILPADVFSPILARYAGFGVTLRYLGATAEGGDILLRKAAVVAPGYFERLLPTYRRQLTFAAPFDKYEIATDYQVTSADLSLPMLGMIGAIGLVSFVAVLVYSSIYHRREIERLRGQQNLFALANFDFLTGLPNRNLLFDRFERALARARRNRSEIAVFFLDLDGFKSVNDRFGHAIGDQVLQQVAARLAACVREEDTCARLAGDEFVIVAEHSAGSDAAKRIVDEATHAFASLFPVGPHKITLGVSIGHALYPRDGDTVAALLHHADLAMYKDKTDR